MPTKEQRKEQNKRYYANKKAKVLPIPELVPELVIEPKVEEVSKPVEIPKVEEIVEPPKEVPEVPEVQEVQEDENTITEEEYEQYIELMADKMIKEEQEKASTSTEVKPVESKPNFFFAIVKDTVKSTGVMILQQAIQMTVLGAGAMTIHTIVNQVNGQKQLIFPPTTVVYTTGVGRMAVK
jgi:hypothetical protein